MRKVFTLFLVLINFLSFAAYKDNSVLAIGDWYKIGITQDGIFKIDATFIRKLGIDVAKIDAKTIQIFGNGGGMLPQANNMSRTDDLAECPLFVVGFEDGKFDANDYLLFYGKATDNWSFNITTQIFEQAKNLYSDTAFYFITYGQNVSKKIPTINNEATQTEIIQTSDERTYYEKDLTNVIQSGREWYGESFVGILNQSFVLNTPDLVANSDIKLNLAIAVLPKNNLQTSFNLSLNNVGIGTMLSNACNCGDNNFKGVNTRNAYKINSSQISNTQNLTLAMAYNKAVDGGATGYLNNILVNYKRNIALNGSQLLFRSIQSKNVNMATYKVANANQNIQIWDVSNINQTQNINYLYDGGAIFTTQTENKIKEFVAFDPAKITNIPTLVGKITNQNLHGSQASEFVIITHPLFLKDANRLADFRRSSGITTSVVTINQIYNEFSSGAQDVTAIKDYCRMLWQNGALKNLLLFGGCSYDYKNRVANNTNFVPTYESYESLHQVNSYSSDDYFGLLADNQGGWIENFTDISQIQIGIGRLPTKNAAEAKFIVDKLIHYSNSARTIGKWRNKICFMADNGDGNSHLLDAEKLAKNVDNSNKIYNINKIYLDGFQLISTPAGNASPQTKAAIQETINQGALIINYSGHGGPEQLAQEGIVNENDIKSWNNFDKLPFFVTATCDFGVYDDPAKTSGGIKILVAEKSGGIGVITAGRPVYQNTNLLLNNAFYEEALNPNQAGIMPSLGSIIRNTKNKSLAGVNNRSYALLGDPSMTLNYPVYKIYISSVNGQNINNFTDTLKALSKTTLSGEIRDANNIIMTDFHGVILSDVFDKYANLSTLGQVSGSGPVDFKLRNNTIQSGQATIRGGKFSLSFVVPKDINYQFDAGKISLYAYQNNFETDAGGYNGDIIIGGSNPNAPIDTTAPKIVLFMDDSTFINGGYTSTEPTLIAKLSDENGINIARSGIGHEISGTLSTDITKSLMLNDYYTSNLDDYKKGKVVYKLDKVPEGEHTFSIKAWDTFNNSAEASINFIVASSNKIAIQKLLNYPNPFTENTTFRITHNRAGEDLELNIKIISIDGRLVKEINETIVYSPATLQLDWNISENDNTIMPGMYVYNCVLKSRLDGTYDKAFQKLVLIR